MIEASSYKPLHECHLQTGKKLAQIFTKKLQRMNMANCKPFSASPGVISSIVSMELIKLLPGNDSEVSTWISWSSICLIDLF